VFKNIGEQILTRFKTDIKESPFVVPEEEKRESVKLKLVSTPQIISSQASAEKDTDEPYMPDFRRMTIKDALKKAREKGIDVKIAGSGWAVNQEPKAGVSLLTHRSCTVTFSTGY
jgi:cell division protein FtsI (penicillin-binding protein 3)